MAVARKRLKVERDVAEPAAAVAEEEVDTPVRRAKRPGPSRRTLAAIILLVAGIVIVMLGWYGAAHTNIFTEQIPYVISGGLLGVALIIVAGVVATGEELLRETRELRADLDRTLQALSMTGLPARGKGEGPSRVLVVPGGRTYHVPGCPIPEGKKVTTLPIEEAQQARFTACKLCAD